MIFRKERSVTRDDEKKILMTFIRLEGRERETETIIDINQYTKDA